MITMLLELFKRILDNLQGFRRILASLPVPATRVDVTFHTRIRIHTEHLPAFVIDEDVTGSATSDGKLDVSPGLPHFTFDNSDGKPSLANAAQQLASIALAQHATAGNPVWTCPKCTGGDPAVLASSAAAVPGPCLNCGTPLHRVI